MHVCPLVQTDVQLKEEWIRKPLRQKCWPLPMTDQEETEQQANELLSAGWIEAFPPVEIPLYAFCARLSWWTKRNTKHVAWSVNSGN